MASVGALDHGGANAQRSEVTMIDKTYQPTEVEGRVYATWEAARARPRKIPRQGMGVEGGIRRHHHQAVETDWRLLRLVARAFHHGRGALARGRQGIRGAVPRRPDLQGQAPGQLGPEIAHRDLG